MGCYSAIGIPEPCGGWTVYDSYVVDPRYQVFFTLGWIALLGLATIIALPSIVKSIGNGRWKEGGFYGLFGIYEDLTPGGYSRMVEESTGTTSTISTEQSNGRLPKPILSILALIKSISYTTPRLPSFFSYLPNFLSLNRRTPSCHPTQSRFPFSFGTLLLVALIPALFVATILPESQLQANPNRFGFIALASILPLFVLSAKNGVISYLTGKGWTSINFLHRWLGRFVVVTVLLHFYFWAIQWSARNQLGVFLSSEKEVRGLLALGFLLLIGLSSIRPMRRFSYPIFFILHYVGIVGFLFYVNRHTVYAQGWATYTVVAIYGLDIVGRLKGMRIRYVEVEALEGGMTRVGITGVRGGWRAGQHLSIRLFFTLPTSRSILSAFRSFEAHPFSIANAPSSIGILNSLPPPSSDSTVGVVVEKGINLFIKSCGEGTWTGDLFNFARMGAKVARAKEALLLSNSSSTLLSSEVQIKKKQVLHMYALVEGPYGGLGYDELDQENLFLVAGGSGMSFTLGLLDEVAGRRRKSGKGGRIEVVWAVRERAHIAWFAESLRQIIESTSSQSNLSILLRIYITCDSSLTTTTTSATTTSLYYSSTSTSSPSEIKYDLPSTQLHYSRPQLNLILSELIEISLAPCGNCWPVCRCGEKSGSGGMCSNNNNDDEGCCGGSNSTSPVENGKELFFGEDVQVGGEKSEWSSSSEKEKIIEVLPVLKSCCGGKAVSLSSSISEDKDLITEFPSSSSPSCCAPTPITNRSNLLEPAVCGGGCCAGTGSGCCTGGMEGVEEKIEKGPLRIRTNGLGVVVCGPGEMIGELRNAVARIPLGRQVRIGGIDFHAEHFSL